MYKGQVPKKMFNNLIKRLEIQSSIYRNKLFLKLIFFFLVHYSRKLIEIENKL